MITYDDVSSAAEKLLSEGEKPTIERIRRMLGEGSNTTIQKHLSTFKSVRSEQRRSILPASLPQELMGPFEQLWLAAEAKANEAYQQNRHAFEASMAEMTATLTSLEGRLSDQQSMADKEISALQQQLFEANELNKQYVLKNTGLNDAINSLRIEAEDRTRDMNLAVQKLEEAIGAERDRFDANQKYWSTRFAEMQADSEKTLFDYRKRLDQAQDQIKAFESFLSQEKVHVGHLQTKIALLEQMATRRSIKNRRNPRAN